MHNYSLLLKQQGIKVIEVDGIDWWAYRGFMLPAYLPHCVPKIPRDTAKRVLKISGKPFVRWDEKFGEIKDGQWWYILKKGVWSVDEVKDKKKRWMIRQGKKNFITRPLMLDEVVKLCPAVAKSASERYKGRTEIETEEVLTKRVEASKKIPGVLEYLGCFFGDKLVSFSENYIQDNAVWLANMRHVPEYLNKYSSYGFLDGILEYYLNNRRMKYVIDGCRSIHHRTNFQEHLEKIFGFTREYAKLNVEYSFVFKMAIYAAYPFRNLVWSVSNAVTNDILDNISAVLRQEQIKRWGCKF